MSSSTAVALVANDAPAGEAAAALGDAERRALPVAIAALRHNLAVANPDDPDAEERDLMLSSECMRAIVNMRPEMSPDARADWVTSVMADFDGKPYQLVLEAVASVREGCRHPADFAPNVIAIVASRRARLEAEVARLEQLSEAIT